MVMIKIKVMVAFFLFLLIFLSGCYNGKKSDIVGAPVLDIQNQTVILPLPVQNINNTNTTEINMTSKVFHNITIVEIPKALEIPENISGVYLTHNVVDYLNYRISAEKYEFLFCLNGIYKNDKLIITNYVEIDYDLRAPSFVKGAVCPLTSVGTVHSHPDAGCIPSDEDGVFFYNQSFPILGIICEINRIVFYTKESSAKRVYEAVVNKRYVPIATYKTILNNDSLPISTIDITPKTPCPGERYCYGECFAPCASGYLWKCTTSGVKCDLTPNGCPTGTSYCNGECWQDCPSGQKWQCTSSGGVCEQSGCPPGSKLCYGKCYSECPPLTQWICTMSGAVCKG